MKRCIAVLLSAALLHTLAPASAQSYRTLTSAAQMSGAQVQLTQSTTGPVVFDSSRVYVNPNLGRLSGFLNTDTSWQLIQVPLSPDAALNPASEVSLSVSGLPVGLKIVLARASVAGTFLLLNVDVTRGNTNAVPRGVATVTVLSGKAALARFQVAVQVVDGL